MRSGEMMEELKKTLCKPLLWILVIGVCFVFGLLMVELCNQNKLLGWELYKIAQSDEFIKENMSKIYDLFLTINTILAATVIFFYSIQNNKTMGVSNRTILAYSFGSCSVPVCFMMTMFLLPTALIFLAFKMIFTFIFSVIFGFSLQIIIIIIILVSTSYGFCLNVINNAEIKKYNNYCLQLSRNRLFVTQEYILADLDQIVICDESMITRIQLIKKIICVPFSEKNKLSIFKMYGKNDRTHNFVIKKEHLKANNLNAIYAFYYGNISSLIECLNASVYNTERNKIYLVLYEFIEKMDKVYEKIKKRKGEAIKNYLMTVSAIMNAILESGVEDAEGFCNYVLNKCIKDQQILRRQIGLYFFFQEYLHRTYIENGMKCNKVRLKNLLSIRDIDKWRLADNDEFIYYEFWQIWTKQTTMSDHASRKYFDSAMATFKNEKGESDPIAYIIQILKQRRKNYENKGHSID